WGDARFRGGKDLPRRHHLSAYGRHGGHLENEDRQIDVPSNGGKKRPAGVSPHVMPRHSASEDARERAYDPGIPRKETPSFKEMDCRVKPGNDDLELAPIRPRTHDGQ